MTVVVESEEAVKKLFEEAVLATREDWLFESAKDEDGKPVLVWVKTTIKFRLHDAGDKIRTNPKVAKNEAAPADENRKDG